MSFKPVSPDAPAPDALPYNRISRPLDRLLVAIGEASAWLWHGAAGRWPMCSAASLLARLHRAGGNVLAPVRRALMLALAYAVVRDDHVRVDVLSERFSLRSRAWIELVAIVLLALPVIALMIDALIPYAYWGLPLQQNAPRHSAGCPIASSSRACCPSASPWCAGAAVPRVALQHPAVQFPAALTAPRTSATALVRSPDGVVAIMGLEEILVIAMFASFMGLLLLGFPVAWSLAGIGLLFAVVGYVLVEHFDANLWFTWDGTIGVLDARIYGIVANELMVALPLFIFMGIMLDRSGIAERLMHSLVRVLGPLRGGAAVTVVVVGILLAASTGIVGASVALLGMLSIGPMLQANYNKSLAVGTACSVGTLGILIPPSIMLVLMADRLGTSEASVGKLFMGALIPGMMLALMYILYIVIAAWLKK
ncbi:TRAP transporter large permease subunit, partial [Stutzerimonas xanthomarina]|uniref:TRAP transporter large permease subunit n=1 Tax=Stutzerimonas xanthomarina TaxID=271420 RepID=UPI003AA86B91